MSIFDLFCDRKPNHRGVKFNRNAIRGRNLHMESLEERALLSAVPLSTSEYADLRVQYADFNLPENMADMNVITLDLAQGNNLTSLKNAITKARNSTKSDLIVVRTSDTANTLTYTTSSDELTIDIDATQKGTVTIIGLGPQNLVLDANQNCRVMKVSGFQTVANLGGMAIINGKANNTLGGGIVNNNATLVIANSIISENSSIYTSNDNGSTSYGGGIYSSGTLTVIDSIITGNTSKSTHFRSYAGGIYSSGTLIVKNSLISENTTSSSGNNSYGGGIYFGGRLTVLNSTISGNTATPGYQSSAWGGEFTVIVGIWLLKTVLSWVIWVVMEMTSLDMLLVTTIFLPQVSAGIPVPIIILFMIHPNLCL